MYILQYRGNFSFFFSGNFSTQLMTLGGIHYDQFPLAYTILNIAPRIYTIYIYISIYTQRDIFSESYYIKPESDCIYYSDYFRT